MCANTTQASRLQLKNRHVAALRSNWNTTNCNRQNVCLQIWNFVWRWYTISAQHPPCLRMWVWSKAPTQRITKWRHRLYSTKRTWHFCQVRHVRLPV